MKCSGGVGRINERFLGFPFLKRRCDVPQEYVITERRTTGLQYYKPRHLGLSLFGYLLSLFFMNGPQST